MVRPAAEVRVSICAARAHVVVLMFMEVFPSRWHWSCNLYFSGVWGCMVGEILYPTLAGSLRSESMTGTKEHEEHKIDITAPAGSPNSLGAESVRDGRPSREFAKDVKLVARRGAG